MRVKKILRRTTAFLLAILVASTILIRYPGPLKIFLAITGSSLTGTCISIDSLTVTYEPLHLRMEGIIVKPGPHASGFEAKIPSIEADVIMSGPFAKKSMTVDLVKIVKPTVQLYDGVKLPPEIVAKKKPGLVGRVVKSLLALALRQGIRMEKMELVDGTIVVGASDPSARISNMQATISPDGVLRLSSTSEAEWAAKDLRYSGADVLLSAWPASDATDRSVKGRLQFANGTVRSPFLEIATIGGRADFGYSYDREILWVTASHMDGKDITITDEQERQAKLDAIKVQVAATADLLTQNFAISQWQINLADLLSLNGKGHARIGIGEPTTAELTIAEGRFVPEKLLALFTPLRDQPDSPLQISGAVGVRGKLMAAIDQMEWNWRSDVVALFSGNAWSYNAEGMDLHGTASGKLGVKNEFPARTLTVGLDGIKLRVEGHDLDIGPFSVVGDISGQLPNLAIPKLALHVEQMALGSGAKQYQVEDIVAQIRNGRINLDSWALSLPELQISSSLLQNLQLSIEKDENQTVINARGKDCHLLETAHTLGLLPTEWRFSGYDTLELGLKETAPKQWAGNLVLTLRDFDFANPGGGIAATNLTARARAEADINWDLRQVTVNSSRLEADNGELLANGIHVDLRDNPLGATGKGRYSGMEKKLDLATLELGLAEMVQGLVTGSLAAWDTQPETNLTVHVSQGALAPLFRDFVKGPFKTRYPVLASLAVAGMISADLEVQGPPKTPAIKGNVRWQHGSMAGEKLALKGIDLNLPLWHQGAGTKTEGSEVQGHLTLESLTLPRLPEQALSLPLLATPNRIFAQKPVRLAYSGGEIELGPIVVLNLLGDTPSLETSLILQNLDIEALLLSLWPPPVAGRLDGTLPRLHIDRNVIRSEGELLARVFGGRVRLSDLMMTGAFSPEPALSLQAEIDGVLLADLTRDTSLDEITGVLHGHVTGLELKGLKPKKFDLLLETLRTKGIPQEISFKAIQNIADFAGDRNPLSGKAEGFTAFLQTLPYGKMGIHAILEDGSVRMNGLVKEEGKEYLVHRGTPAGVSIVNQNAGRQILLKEIEDKIERIRSAAEEPSAE